MPQFFRLGNGAFRLSGPIWNISLGIEKSPLNNWHILMAISAHSELVVSLSMGVQIVRKQLQTIRELGDPAVPPIFYLKFAAYKAHPLSS